MNASVLMAVLAALTVAILALPMLGLVRVAVTGFLFASVVVPFPLLTWDPEVQDRTGITSTSPSITTYSLALCLLVVGLAPNWRRNGWLLSYEVAVIAYLVVGLLTVWSGAEAQWSGAIHWLFALVALASGFQLGTQLSDDLYRFIVRVVLMLLLLNGVLCVVQLAGLPISLYPGQLADNMMDGRPIGTFSHPSTPGKLVIISLLIVLPAIRSADCATRRMAWCCVCIAVPIVALTLARANLAAVAAAIILWLVFDRRSRNAIKPTHVLLVTLALIASMPVVGATLERFITDPGGGDRAGIYRTGLKQILSNTWGGTGPNFYVEIVGRWDQMTAWGYPLHNTFLYPVAELGLIGGVLFLMPVFVVCAMAICDLVSNPNPSLWSKSYLVTFPGLMGIAMTGWGMLIGSTLYLWFFAIGMCAAGIVNVSEAASNRVGCTPSSERRSGSPASVGRSSDRFLSYSPEK